MNRPKRRIWRRKLRRRIKTHRRPKARKWTRTRAKRRKAMANRPMLHSPTSPSRFSKQSNCKSKAKPPVSHKINFKSWLSARYIAIFHSTSIHFNRLFYFIGIRSFQAGFRSVDNQERDRIDSKNALEEFVLNIRGRVNDSDDLEPYIEPNVRDELVQLADSTENWLYDEGEDCKKNEYVEKLQKLQVISSNNDFIALL